MSEIISVEAREITDYEEAFRTHQRIMANGTIAAQALFEVCKDLKHMRDEKLYAELGYENFEDYCEQMAGIKSRMAYNYISTYERLGPSVLQSNANLGITKLELIAGMNPVDRAEGLASGEFENMSVSEIKELIKKNREMGEQINLLQERLEDAQSADEESDSAEDSGYDAEKDEMYEKIKELEEQLRNKDSAHKIEIEELTEKISGELREELKSELAGEVSEQDNSAEIQKQIDAAVTLAKKETEKEVKAKLKEKTEKQAERIKELESVITADADEKEKLHKQLALADTKSAQAMVYVQAIQDNFNSLFSLISDMETEQQNKFKGAVLKLTNAMKEKAES